MLIPKLLIVIATYELSTGFVVCHFLSGALELWDIVEEIE